MNKELVSRFMSKKPELEKIFSKKHPEEYKEIIKSLVALLNTGNENGDLDPERIHEINDGDYQGTLVYIIAETGYQPSNYWYVKVYYGSCSSCDTLLGISDYEEGLPSKQQIKEYMELALHIVQGLKKMD